MMDLKIKKEEYLECLYEYIERDKKLYLGNLKMLKTITDIDWLYVLKELDIISENLKRNIQLYYATKTSVGNLEFYLDTDTGYPVRNYIVKNSVKDKLLTQIKEEENKTIKTMFG